MACSNLFFIVGKNKLARGTPRVFTNNSNILIVSYALISVLPQISALA